MGKFKTNEQFLQEVQSQVGNEYSFLEPYFKTHTKIQVRHNICNNNYLVTPNDFIINKHRCPKCQLVISGKKRRMSNEEFMKRVLLFDDHKEYLFKGSYVKTHEKIPIIHLKCGYEFAISPTNYLKGKRCPKCAGNIKRTNEQFILEVKKLVGEEYKFLEEYVNTDTYIKVKHNSCGEIYKISPKEFLLYDARCPFCLRNGIFKKSMPANKLERYLRSIGLDVKMEYRFDNLRSKPFDIYLPELNIVIEYDGEQHFKPKYGIESFMAQKRRDSEKNDFMINNNISFFRINYLKKKFITDIAQGIIEERSTTIEKFNLYYSHDFEIFNNISYYTECNLNYFE